MKKLSAKSRHTKILLVLIFFVALVLRWLYLPKGAITFGYDQARDAFIVQQILNGDLKVLGPPVGGLPGIFHGVFYYYVIAPAYYFGHGDPIIVAYWMSFLNALGVFLVYFFVKKLTDQWFPSFLAALIYSVSFEATQYANWLSNVSLGILFVPAIYFGIWLWLKTKQTIGAVVTGLALGLSIQCNAALAYHGIPVIFWLYVQRGLVNSKSLVLFFVSLIISMLSMIISELKFNEGGIAGLWYLFSSQDKVANSVKFGEFLVNYFNQLGNVFSLNIFPLNPVFGALIGIILYLRAGIILSKAKVNEFLTWPTLLLSAPIGYIFALAFGGGSTPHITVGIATLLSAVMGITIWQMFMKSKIFAIVFLVVILCSNIVKIVLENDQGQTNFAIQKGLVLSSEISAIELTYRLSEGGPFSISTLTSPLYVNTTWSYLYNWYGMSKYGYLPSWIGNDQIGQLGNNLEFASKDTRKHFFIMEPTYSIPELYINYSKGDQDSLSNLVSQTKIGQIVVQERVKK